MFTIHFTEEVGPQDYNQIIHYCIPTIYQITLLRVSVLRCAIQISILMTLFLQNRY